MKTLDFDPADVKSRQDIADINSGKKRAVDDKERLTNLLNQAAQFQNDVSPANHSPMKFLCVQFEKLQSDHLRLRVDLQEMVVPVLAMDPDTGRFAELPRVVAQFFNHIEIGKRWAP